ncbi:hypothetical protein AMR72_14270 [Flavobacterium psychrophilum]|nr:hypothetical protein AMR72_14270 [Flavobacterium psychrophilum]AOE53580.1 hypothetical protein ALW18_14260 [Flavobacterium psychrophilum]
MKKTLLILSLCASMLLPSKVIAQDDVPYTLNLFNKAVFYGMYEGTVQDKPVPEGAIRHRNYSYAKMLTQDQLDSFGNTLKMTVVLNPLCDNYDRIGNVNMVLVPKAQTSYDYQATDIKRFEIGRFITPFMRLTVTNPNAVPYEYELNHLTNVFHDESITADYNVWIEFEVYGYQGGPGQGGAAVEVPGCAGRNDVYMGSLTFESTNSPNIIYGDDHVIMPLSHKYELKNYTLDGTDELNKTVRTIKFTLAEAVPNAKLHLITSNHGSGTNGEEYVRREHFVYMDGNQVANYIPGGVSCVPFSVYNTQPNCVYLICTQFSSNPRPDTDAAWSWNNWCPGDKIPNRVIDLGSLAAGEHSFKIEVPSAEFYNDEGYFPMSAYVESTTTTLDTKEFDLNKVDVYPNPVTDVALIQAPDMQIKNVTVINTVGQTVFTGATDKINMSQLQSGIYIVRVEFDNNQVAVKKIIKK